MRGSFYPLTYGTIVGLLLLLLAGCASTETPRHYLLSALPGEAAAQPPCFSLGIGPVKLPEYLNRPQIVTRASTNELTLGQFDRWAEPLDHTFLRVLAENVTKLLCTTSVSLFPWKASTQIDYRVEAEVMRMDGVLGGEAILEVWWAISNGRDNKVLISKQSKFREPVAANDYGSMVQAQSRLSASFSREVAEAIGKLTK